MRDSDAGGLRADDVLRATSLLTRLPLPQPDWNAERPAGHAAWAYPIAGLAIGLVGVVVLAAGTGLGVAPAIVSALVVAAMVMASGALHEDGLADCADGFWGGWTREKRLRIMKDSRIGAYGVLALFLILLTRWAALSQLIDAGSAVAAILTAAMVSRAAMVVVMGGLPHAREDGLSHKTGRPLWLHMGLAVAIALVFATATLGAAVFPIVAAAGLAALAVAALSWVKIGGQTGDVLGATQQISETAILIVLSALLAA